MLSLFKRKSINQRELIFQTGEEADSFLDPNPTLILAKVNWISEYLQLSQVSLHSFQPPQNIKNLHWFREEDRPDWLPKTISPRQAFCYQAVLYHLQTKADNITPEQALQRAYHEFLDFIHNYLDTPTAKADGILG